MKAGDLAMGAALLALRDLSGRCCWTIDEPILTAGVALRVIESSADRVAGFQRDEFADL